MTGRDARVAVAVGCGAVFGFGLALSGMVNPANVRGFLDVFGMWNPSLAFVLGGAVFVAAIGVAAMRRMARPLFDTVFHLPTAQTVDTRLLLGSAIFGVGWGIGGLCPGPALAALSFGPWLVAVFVLAMVIGMVAHDRFVSSPRR